jgi:hypothetical protein
MDSQWGQIRYEVTRIPFIQNSTYCWPIYDLLLAIQNRKFIMESHPHGMCYSYFSNRVRNGQVPLRNRVVLVITIR